MEKKDFSLYRQEVLFYAQPRAEQQCR